jgi:peptidyl-prolyl cis-trans isomerase SurA
MNFRFSGISAALALSALALSSYCAAQTAPAAANSPYGGVTVEDIIARVNDQIISQSDYDRALKELDQEGRERGATMQEISAQHKDLLRNMIDQQLWLSKGKELGITGDTELIKRLDEIRKQNNLATMEDLENAAKEQGVSFEDFKANIRNGIITQEVMRQQVGQKIQFTPGEAMAYFEQHKKAYQQPESVRLAEILISTGTDAGAADDPAKVAAAKAKADDIEARLAAGGDFAQLARSFSEGPTAAEGGELGQFKRGGLAKVLEDKTFVLAAGKATEPIRTRQGYVILKVEQHIGGGDPEYKDVKDQVEEAYYMERMEPAIRAYLTNLRENSFIDIKPGYTDTGASPNETKPIFSAYTPPAPKKKAAVERTRYRESTAVFRQKSPQQKAPAPDEADAPAATPGATATDAATAKAAATAKKKKDKKDKTELAAEKPGKKEKIRFGQAPRETLPTAEANSATENAGALPETASAADVPVSPLEAAAPTAKTRYSSRAIAAKKEKTSATPKSKSKKASAVIPPPDSTEVADRQTQAAPLGLGGNTAPSKKKKKTATTTGDKTRLAQEPKKPAPPAPQQTIPAPVPGAPAPAEQ